MNSKYVYPVVVFFASFILIIAGMAFKIQHWPGTSIIFGAGMLVQMFAVLWLIIVILKGDKK